MNENTPCCQHLLTPGMVLSYSQIAVVGYYDGPTDGAIRCSLCGDTYRFDMLDWNSRHTIRVFSLAPLPMDRFLRLKELLDREPDSTVSPKDDRAVEYQQLKAVLDNAGPVEAVIAWRRDDERVVAAAKVKADDRRRIQDWSPWMEPKDPSARQDWFSFVGLPRH